MAPGGSDFERIRKMGRVKSLTRQSRAGISVPSKISSRVGSRSIDQRPGGGGQGRESVMTGRAEVFGEYWEEGRGSNEFSCGEIWRALSPLLSFSPTEK